LPGSVNGLETASTYVGSESEERDEHRSRSSTRACAKTHTEPAAEPAQQGNDFMNYFFGNKQPPRPSEQSSVGQGVSVKEMVMPDRVSDPTHMPNMVRR
jgi:hypothetical protein